MLELGVWGSGFRVFGVEGLRVLGFFRFTVQRGGSAQGFQYQDTCDKTENVHLPMCTKSPKYSHPVTQSKPLPRAVISGPVGMPHNHTLTNLPPDPQGSHPPLYGTYRFAASRLRVALVQFQISMRLHVANDNEHPP